MAQLRNPILIRACAWSLLSPLFLGGCGEDAVCLPGVAAVSVHALSAAAGTPILDAQGEVHDGSFTDSLVPVGQGYYEAAPNRPGTYGVHLEAPSYAAWDTSGIAVLSPGRGCSLFETSQVEARLLPIE
jgi:hypothetical protein